MRRDAATALLRALHSNIVNFVNFAGAFRVESLASRPWASVTFCGARHRVSFVLEGADAAAAADAFVAGLAEAEFDLLGHILADIALVDEQREQDGERVRLTIEALTVDDGDQPARAAIR